MVDVSIDAVSSIRRDVAASYQRVVPIAFRRLRGVAARIRAAGEFACIEERLRDDAGLTRERYLDAAR